MASLTIKGITLSDGKPLICVPIVSAKREDILEEIRQITGDPALGIRMIEWRADFYEDLDKPEAVADLLAHAAPFLTDCIFLFTIRSKAQGGRVSLDEKLLSHLHMLAAGSGVVDFVDLEYLEWKKPEKQIARIQKKGCRVIASHHDFEKTPDPALLAKLIGLMYRDGADIAKAAVMPQSRKDVLTLLSLTADVKESWPDRLLITMSMGGAGSISRICGEAFGSCVSFGSLHKASAPGQIPVADLDRALSILHRAMEQK